MTKTKLYTFYMGLYGAPTKARVQSGISGSYMYMDTVFELVPHEDHLDKSTTQFYQGRLTVAFRLVEFV